MLSEAKPFLPPAAPAACSSELSAATLLELLSHHTAKALVFSYDGRDVLPGYHVTEVKTGSFEGLDCGANTESWSETFIQLWDVPPTDGRSFMPAATFLAIIDKVRKAVAFDPGAKLTFEVSDGVRAMQIYRASSFDTSDDVVRVALTPRPASCKPRDRWLEQDSAETMCKPSTDAAACCN